MLMCNGVVLNTTNPTTELEKQVARELQNIAKDYGLKRKSGSVVFTYPDSLIKPDRDNPGKFDSPKGISLRYVSNEVLDDGGGTREWRYFTNSHLDKNGKTVYTPISEIFTGRLELNLSQIELIYYFINIFPNTEGGKNHIEGEKVYIKRKDVVADNRKIVTQRSKAAAINAKLYLNPSEGGFSDEALKDLALRVGISASHMTLPLATENRDSLILAIDNKFKIDPSLAEMAKQSQAIPDKDMEIRKIIQQAKDLKVIALVQKSGKNVGWGVINPETGIYEKLVGMPFNANEDGILLKHLSSKPQSLEQVKQLVKSAEEALEDTTDTTNEFEGE